MSDFVLALDQGTSSSRAILFDHEGHAVASAQREFRQVYPQPGWVEHDANEIWESQLAVAQEALKTAGATAANISAIGITNTWSARRASGLLAVIVMRAASAPASWAFRT